LDGFIWIPCHSQAESFFFAAKFNPHTTNTTLLRLSFSSLVKNHTIQVVVFLRDVPLVFSLEGLGGTMNAPIGGIYLLPVQAMSLQQLSQELKL